MITQSDTLSNLFVVSGNKLINDSRKNSFHYFRRSFEQVFQSCHSFVGHRQGFTAGSDADGIRWSNKDHTQISGADQLSICFDCDVFGGDEFLRNRIDHCSVFHEVFDFRFLYDLTTITIHFCMEMRRDTAHGNQNERKLFTVVDTTKGPTVELDEHPAHVGEVFDQLFKRLSVFLLDRDRDDHPRRVLAGHGNHAAKIGNTIGGCGATADVEDGFHAPINGGDSEVLGISKGCFGTKTETACFLPIMPFGRATIGAIDVTHHIGGDTGTNVMEGHFGIGDLNDHRLVLFPRFDVCIPRIAKHFADNCKLFVGIESGREDFEEFCILLCGKRLHVSTANDGVSVKMVDMRHLHR